MIAGNYNSVDEFFANLPRRVILVAQRLPVDATKVNRLLGVFEDVSLEWNSGPDPNSPIPVTDPRLKDAFVVDRIDTGF